MKKAIAAMASILLSLGFVAPAQSAGAKYSVYQKTLATFSSTATTLTSQQKAQVKAAVDANPTAEKFICTGIRYYSQPMSVNIMVRKRAKAACEYAKQLNPELSTWYQNKPTQARSYAGKVLLTVKSPMYDTSSTGASASSDKDDLVPLEKPWLLGVVGGGLALYEGKWTDEWPQLEKYSLYLCDAQPDVQVTGWSSSCDNFNLALEPRFIFPASTRGKYLGLEVTRKNIDGGLGTFSVVSDAITSPGVAIGEVEEVPVPLVQPSLMGDNTVLSEISLDVGVWPPGWVVQPISGVFLCKGSFVSVADKLGDADCPLFLNAHNGTVTIPSVFAGRYVAARVVVHKNLGARTLTHEFDLYRDTPLSAATPVPLKEPRVIFSGQLDTIASLDKGVWSRGITNVALYSVFLLCDGPIERSIAFVSHGLHKPNGCIAAGSVGSPPTISSSWAGKHLGATLHMLTSSNEYFNFVVPSIPIEGESVLPPQPVETSPPQPVETSPPESAEDAPLTGQWVYYTVRRQDSADCKTTNQASEFVNGKVDLPVPQYPGLTKWVYSAEFVRQGSGGYSTLGSAVLWERPALWSNNWSPVDLEIYNIPWRAVVELTCRVWK